MPVSPASPNGFRDMFYASHYQVRFVLTKLDRVLPADQVPHLMDFLAHLLITNGLRPLTVASYCDSMIDFIAWISEKKIPLDAVEPIDIEAWSKSLYLERRLGPQKRTQKLTAVRRFFGWRELLGLGDSPARNIRGPKRHPRLPKKFSTHDLQALFATCADETLINIRDFAVLMFMYSTGARREEIINLNMDQLVIQERVGRVNFLGKGAKERQVSFEGPAVDALRHWLIERDRLPLDEPEPVFVSLFRGKGCRMQNNWLDSMFQKRGRRAKLKFHTPHIMRSTFATDMYDQGEDIEVIQKLMGHEKIETTRGYIVISERHQRVRLKTSRLNESLGRAAAAVPLWIQKKTGEGLFSE